MWATEKEKKCEFAMLNRENKRDRDGGREWRWMERH